MKTVEQIINVLTPHLGAMSTSISETRRFFKNAQPKQKLSETFINGLIRGFIRKINKIINKLISSGDVMLDSSSTSSGGEAESQEIDTNFFQNDRIFGVVLQGENPVWRRILQGLSRRELNALQVFLNSKDSDNADTDTGNKIALANKLNLVFEIHGCFYEYREQILGIQALETYIKQLDQRTSEYRGIQWFSRTFKPECSHENKKQAAELLMLVLKQEAEPKELVKYYNVLSDGRLGRIFRQCPRIRWRVELARYIQIREAEGEFRWFNRGEPYLRAAKIQSAEWLQNQILGKKPQQSEDEPEIEQQQEQDSRALYDGRLGEIYREMQYCGLVKIGGPLYLENPLLQGNHVTTRHL